MSGRRNRRPPFAIGLGAMALAAVLAACAPKAPEPFVVSETTSPHAARLPMITVRRGDGAPFSREEWVVAEAAARDHCAGQSATYARLPPSRDYTEMRLEDGAFSFMARCTRP